MAIGFVALIACSGKWSLAHMVFTTERESINPAGVGSVLMLALTGFTFLEISGCTSAETYDAASAVPKAMIMTLGTGTLIFALICFCIAGLPDIVVDASSKTMIIAGTPWEANCPGLVRYLLGPLGGWAFFAGVVLSIVGGTFGALLALARVGYSMSINGLFPKQFSITSADGVPVYALWFQVICVTTIAMLTLVCSRVGLFGNAYIFLGETFGFMYALIGMLYAVCFLSLRYTDAQMPRPFKVGKSIYSAWLVALVTVSIWGYAAFFCVQPVHQITGVLIALSGVPIYFFYKNKARHKQIDS
jgi:APA family basic amino acid/polyamine antiporter